MNDIKDIMKANRGEWTFYSFDNGREVLVAGWKGSDGPYNFGSFESFSSFEDFTRRNGLENLGRGKLGVAFFWTDPATT
ncbi:MAG: hypothetical protein M0R06_02525 [Sphaerochaeta sp.]|jgi:hypothetical protein|nr:hypothetical protein [Sphaerochaeta sp.]